MQETEKIWMNGELVAWDDARIHVGTHGLHYGSGVFEGIRAYETERGTGVFRLRDHLERLEASAAFYYMELPYSLEKLRDATHELIRSIALLIGPRPPVLPPPASIFPTAAPKFS